MTADVMKSPESLTLTSAQNRQEDNQQELTRNGDNSADVIVAVVELWPGDVVDRHLVHLLRLYSENIC